MNVLVINPGSSTVKFKLFSKGKELIKKRYDRYKDGADIFNNSVSLFAKLITKDKKTKDIVVDKIGIRVVHGGDEFTKETQITSKNFAKLQRLNELAPLHNPVACQMIKKCFVIYKNIPVIAVFDTQFHNTIPDKARLYAIPYALSKKYGIKKYGFHGISHEYIYKNAKKVLKSKKELKNVITCHLGSGSSLCAIHNGKSMDTSMGMSPVDGLMMTTRTGDVDHSIIFYLHKHAKLSYPEIEEIINKKSGILGIYGKSFDMREVRKNYRKSKLAKLAMDMFVYKVQEYIGQYASVLDGVDVLVFSGGIGEGSPLIRSMICENLSYLGVKIDHKKNKHNKPGVISSWTSKVKVVLVHTDESKAIEEMINY